MDDIQKYKDLAIRYIDENSELFTGVSRSIWEKPELSMREYHAAALYCRVLREHGFEVTEKLGSKIVPGLFFAGEILDVNGDCGGYNLQWAASSAMTAAREACSA